MEHLELEEEHVHWNSIFISTLHWSYCIMGQNRYSGFSESASLFFLTWCHKEGLFIAKDVNGFQNSITIKTLSIIWMHLKPHWHNTDINVQRKKRKKKKTLCFWHEFSEQMTLNDSDLDVFRD